MRILKFTALSVALLFASCSETEIPAIEPNVVREVDFESEELLKEALNYEFIQRETPDSANTGEFEFRGLSLNDSTRKEAEKDRWWAVGPGCSWYCGGYYDSIYCSSQLDSTKGNSYKCKNIGDLRFNTPWIEGAKGYGIGEWVEFKFNKNCPRITTIMVCNGYNKSKKAWQENSRVKDLKLYYNNAPFCILKLKDVRGIQTFEFEVPFGCLRDENGDIDDNAKDWALRFEIADVYPGDKYDDTALSEIYFDGIDVH